MQNIISKLEALLQKYAIGDAFNIYAAYGFLCAQTILPTSLTESKRNEIFFDGTAYLTKEDALQFNEILANIVTQFDRDFNSEEDSHLSFLANQESLNHLDESDLLDWCGGFMEAHFIDESQWFEGHEQEVSELMLPIMLASGLFDEEPEFSDILINKELTQEIYSQIPMVLTELYLLKAI